MVYNSNDIQKIIPHRYPFLLVDQIDSIGEDGTSIVGHKCVSANEMQFLGHFPPQHLMPGVFAGINKMRFRRMVIPGDVLKLEVKLTTQRAGIYFADVCASVDGEVAARGEIMCALSDAK